LWFFRENFGSMAHQTAGTFVNGFAEIVSASLFEQLRKCRERREAERAQEQAAAADASAKGSTQSRQGRTPKISIDPAFAHLFEGGPLDPEAMQPPPVQKAA
jgi:hypothetical protein